MKELCDQIREAIKNRSSYDDACAAAYNVRHNGVQRTKQFPWQSNLPLKITDPAIDKIKPALIAMVFQQETFSTFYSLNSEANRWAKTCAQYQSYWLKRNRSFFKAINLAADFMLTYGKSLLKIYRDVKHNENCFEAIAPTEVIVPITTTDLQRAEWLVHVQRWSPIALKSNPKFQVSDKVFRKIQGISSNYHQLRADQFEREGLTYCVGDEVLIWEIYYKVNGEWHIKWVSPLAPDLELRKQQPLPYHHGRLPFAEFNAELCDNGYYSPRGIAHKVFLEETVASMFRNYYLDHLRFSAMPVFQSDGSIINNNNLTFGPGQVLPKGIAPIQLPPPPMQLMQEMMGARQLAEQNIGSFDYAQIITGPKGGSKARTATEVAQISNIQASSIDLRARLFRAALTEVYRQDWSLTIQFSLGNLKYYWQNEIFTIEQKALHVDWAIEPSGNPDGMNKQVEVAQAMELLQLLNGNPAIDQEELLKYVLETKDPSLVKRFYIGGQTAAASQAEDQAQEISVLLLGFPAQIKPTDDHYTHALIAAQFLQKRALSPEEPTTKQGAMLIQQHILQHLEAMQAKKDPRLAQLKKQLQQIQAETEAQLKAMQDQQLAAQRGMMPEGSQL